MAHEIDLGGIVYISSKRAAELTGYTQDYIGQLARSGAITAQRVSGLWYVVEESLRNHKSKADEFKPTPPQKVHAPDLDAAVSFDGKDYISAQRAAKITGYNQDYVSQLARSEKIVARQIGNRWYVDRAGIVAHKKHNDSLLAAVQTESVGLAPKPAPEIRPEETQELHFNYLKDEEADLIPPVDAQETPKPIEETSKETERIVEPAYEPEPQLMPEPELKISTPVMEEPEPSESVEPHEVRETEEITEIPIRVIPQKMPKIVQRTIIERPPVIVQETKRPAQNGALVAVLVIAIVLVAGGTGTYMFLNRPVDTSGGIPNAQNRNVTARNESGSAGFALPIPDSVRSIVAKELYYKRDR